MWCNVWANSDTLIRLPGGGQTGGQTRLGIPPGHNTRLGIRENQNAA